MSQSFEHILTKLTESKLPFIHARDPHGPDVINDLLLRVSSKLNGAI